MRSRRGNALRGHFFGGRNEHEVLENAVLVALSKLPYVRVWKNETGALPLYQKDSAGHTILDETGEPVVHRYIHYGLPGSGDLTGLVVRGGVGARLEIEVKTGSGKLSKDQRLFRAMILSMGGYYIEARSVEQVLSEVEAIACSS